VIRFDSSVCADLERAKQLEWLETNGLGGFSSSTIVGLNTRRYHGLLTAATKPPVGRFLLLSKLEATLLVDGRRYDLSANQYPGAVYPQGHRFLREFRLDPFPVFLYDVGGVEIEKRVFMVHGEDTVVVEYEVQTLTSDAELVLELRPLIAFRHYHATTQRNDALNRTVMRERGVATIAPYNGLPSLHFGHNAAALEETGDWYYNFEYSAEQERGLDAHEDLFSPFVLRYNLQTGAIATVIASTHARAAADAPLLKLNEIDRRKQVLLHAPSSDQFIHGRGRSIHRPTRRIELRHRRLSLVRRLGPRHDDRAARLSARYRPSGDCQEHTRSLRRERRSGHAAEPFPGRRRNARVQHRGRHALVV
jgi:predicted glycogen debranching enzyme